MAEPEPLRVVYRLSCRPEEDGFERIRAIVLEQTVEIPAAAVSLDLERRVVGTLHSIERLDKRLWRAVVDYPQLVVGLGDLPQLLNWLFGNISLYDGVRVEQVEWPAEVLERFPGPRFGRAGIRSLFPAAAHRPLIVGAVKALGEPPAVLAERAGALARAGFDLIKDDHGLADQSSAPFSSRVGACAEAIASANSKTGGVTRYVPNLTGPVDGLEARLELARSLDIELVMVAPWLLGLDVTRRFCATAGVAVIAHPSFAGAAGRADHGLAPGLLFGDLMRIAGADAVIFPWAGGRFVLDETNSREILERLEQPLGELAPSLPIVGGGLPVDREPPELPLDSALLFGGFLYAAPDLESAARAVVARVERRCGASEPKFRV